MLSVQTMSSRDLLGERGLLRIEHDGEFYTLRVTRNRRLILTK
ncbi:hemin uptake protein HemP [Myxococcota bacterium]|nr:hemin uptake protein HemP [Myxococcota bacterium]